MKILVLMGILFLFSACQTVQVFNPNPYAETYRTDPGINAKP